MVEVQLYIVALVVYPWAKNIKPQNWIIILLFFFVVEVRRIICPSARIIMVMGKTFVTHATPFMIGMTILYTETKYFCK